MEKVTLRFVAPDNYPLHVMTSEQIPLVGHRVVISARNWEVVQITWSWEMTWATIEVRDPENMR